ncbi:addiction module antitoxin, RelB/DinJ family [Bacteroidales bacterium Barb4]|nr:addiction module antitoxin, RelB/DinJ family [Bacteroidales bacterium Barb4]
MADTTITFRVDEQAKQNFDKLCSAIGLTMSTAFNLIVNTAIREQRIPAKLSLNPNLATIEAIQELDKREKSETLKHFSSVAEMNTAMDFEDKSEDDEDYENT